MLISCLLPGFWQPQAPPPGCKPLTYFAVQCCEPSGRGNCLPGYDKQMACPTSPLMKAPCRVVCVADIKNTGDIKQESDLNITDTCLKR